MQRLYFLFPIPVLFLLLIGCSTQALPPDTEEILKAEVVPYDPPASCPVTQPPAVAFVPPAPYPPKPPERSINEFWYVTPELWTMLRSDATWSGLPHNRYGYTQKVFWWSQDFHVSEDPYPVFRLTIERLDAGAPSSPVVVSEEATNASAGFGTAMLTGVDIPELGCWKITGKYGEAELSFVVWVAP
jgi:hypothetical protein